MVSVHHTVEIPGFGDFLVDGKFSFEIGGRKKTFEQIKNQEHAFLACDDLERGIGNRIPLWLFGFLY
jgi:hypothetical protein